MDARHQRCIVCERLRHGDVCKLERLLCISEIKLVEDAMSPVLCKRRPVLITERTTLGEEPAKIGPFSELVAVLGLVNTVAANLVVALSHRHDVDTLTRFETDLPVVLRHTCYHVVVGKMPFLSNITVLNPDIRILLSKRNLRHSVLHEDRGVRLTVEMHDLTLVVHQILKSQRGGDHLARGAEMIELAS